MGSGELKLELELELSRGSILFCLPLDIFVVFKMRWCWLRYLGLMKWMRVDWVVGAWTADLTGHLGAEG